MMVTVQRRRLTTYASGQFEPNRDGSKPPFVQVLPHEFQQLVASLSNMIQPADFLIHLFLSLGSRYPYPLEKTGYILRWDQRALRHVLCVS